MAVNLNTSRTQALQNLAKKFPGSASESVNQSNSKTLSNLQQSIGSAPSTMGDVTQAAQSAGGQVAQAQSAAGKAIRQDLRGQTQQVAQAGMQSRNIAGKSQLADQQSQISKQSIDFANRLSAIDNNTKTQLLDRQLAFNKDKRGKAFFNDRQMMDFMAMKAKDSADFQRMAQTAQQASNRKVYMWQTVSKKLNQELNQLQQKESTEATQQAIREIKALQAAAEEKARKEANRAKNKQSMLSTVGAVAGGAVGAVYGGPTGAMVGAQAGGAAGSYIASES